MIKVNATEVRIGARELTAMMIALKNEAMSNEEDAAEIGKMQASIAKECELALAVIATYPKQAYSWTLCLAIPEQV